MKAEKKSKREHFADVIFCRQILTTIDLCDNTKAVIGKMRMMVDTSNSSDEILQSVKECKLVTGIRKLVFGIGMFFLCLNAALQRTRLLDRAKVEGQLSPSKVGAGLSTL
jgi:hypothetical protein